MLGINGWEFVIIALVALFIFGPDKLPGAAKQAGKLMRDARRWTNRARSELTDTLGPEFENFDLADLNPKRFVQKHLLEGLDLDDDPVHTPTQTLPPADDAASVVPVTDPVTPEPAAVAAGAGVSTAVISPGSLTSALAPDGSTASGGGGDDTPGITAAGITSAQSPTAPPSAAGSRPHIDFDAT